MTARLTSAFARHGYVTAVAAVALSTAVFLLGRDAFAKGQWALLYLLVVLLVASVAGAVPAVVAAVLAFFAWNFFFLPPYHTLAVHAAEDWLSLAAFLIVSVIVGVQAGRMREREARALARERETAALNRLSAVDGLPTSTDEVARTLPREAVGGAGCCRGDALRPRRRRAAVAIGGAPTRAPGWSRAREERAIAPRSGTRAIVGRRGRGAGRRGTAG